MYSFNCPPSYQKNPLTIFSEPRFFLLINIPMGLRKAYQLLCVCILFTGFQLVLAQDAFDSPTGSDPFGPTGGHSSLEEESEADHLVELKDRLRQIESMLLAQKDRENALLRDLNKFVLTAQDKPDEAAAETQKEIEAAKQQFRAESTALETKIRSLEAAIAAGHERDIRMGQEMNKTIVVTVSVVAGIGLLVFLVTVYLQYRLISRPVQPYYLQPPPLALEAGHSQLSVGENRRVRPTETELVENSQVEDANERFVSAIERLEARIIHMEEGLARTDSIIYSDSGLPVGETESYVEEAEDNQSRGETGKATNSEVTYEPDSPGFETMANYAMEDDSETDEMDVAVLEEEGKRFLQKEDWETAFRYYDQLVRLDGQRVDNWVNRGRALEMLKREEEAIDSYDHAIMANPDLPSPFLYKAALLSRMERFEEAQKFYNEALSKVPVQKNERATASANL